jgi:adenosylmethionine-8-amino-7-oxononanoate aminotransferase
VPTVTDANEILTRWRSYHGSTYAAGIEAVFY